MKKVILLLSIFFIGGNVWAKLQNTVYEKPIVVVIPSYNNCDWCLKNIESVLQQNYSNYRIVYIDDCSNDTTYTMVSACIDKYQAHNRVTLIRNSKRVGALSNLYHAIHNAYDYEIVVTLDGDDWFSNKNALARINYEYQDPRVWLTYGQFMFWPTEEKGYCVSIIDDGTPIRKKSGSTTHVRTFYAWLFKRIKKQDLMYNGEFFPVTWDKAMMAPMLEMAGYEHIRFINDQLYVYNYNNPLSDARLHGDLQNELAKVVFEMSPYEQLNKQPMLKKEYDNPYNVDMVIFSFDRPLQLFSLLESIEQYVKGLGVVSVIYRVTNAQYRAAYDEVLAAFSWVNAFEQHNPPYDFKTLTLQAAFESPHDYIIFSVDDIIVKDSVDLHACVNNLEQYDAYGFFLRLGKNINYCYTLNCDAPVPNHCTLDNDVCMWQFIQGTCDWDYPHSVDMTIYRKRDIQNDLRLLSYTSPNTLEGQWAGNARTVSHKKGLFYIESKIVNVPLNRVQQDYSNRTMNYLLPHELLEYFQRGLKVDITQLYKINNNAPHMEYEPAFVQR